MLHIIIPTYLSTNEELFHFTSSGPVDEQYEIIEKCVKYLKETSPQFDFGPLVFDKKYNDYIIRRGDELLLFICKEEDYTILHCTE